MASRDGQESTTRESGALVSRTVSLPDSDLLSFVLTTDQPQTVWATPGEASFATWGTATELTGNGADRFNEIQSTAAAVFSEVDRPNDAPSVARPRLVGGFSFHDEHEPHAPWTGFPGATFVLPAIQVTVGDTGAYLTVNEFGDGASPSSVRETIRTVRDRFEDPATGADLVSRPGVESTERTTTREQWREQVEAAVDRIDAGDLEKVVLAQSLAATLGDDLPLASTLARLSETYTDCFRFAFSPPSQDRTESVFFGASPERLVTRQNGRLETGALASTIQRGDTPDEDEWLAGELQSNRKFVHEHELVVDSIRDQLEPVAENVVSGERTVKKLASIQHLFTPIAADTKGETHVLDVVDALHPTPAVGGLPPDAALATIRETESFDRGWYAAPIGWFDAAGDGTFAVGIRSAVAEGDRATLFAGNGIVADSDPDVEWEEVLLKYRPILDHLDHHEDDH